MVFAHTAMPSLSASISAAARYLICVFLLGSCLPCALLALLTYSLLLSKPRVLVYSYTPGSTLNASITALMCVMATKIEAARSAVDSIAD